MDKFDIEVMDQRWGNCPRTALDGNCEISKLLRKPGPLTERPDVWIQVTVPNEFQPIGKHNIGITAGIETDRVASPWIEGMNRMDVNIVPSNHSKDIFEKTVYDKKDKQGNVVQQLKLTKPIKVLFEGLDTSIFDKTESSELLPINGLDSIKESFCFLVCGHWLQGNLTHDRKDIGATLHTFIQTFKDIKNKPALVIKTSSATFSVIDREQTLSKIREIKKRCGINPKDQAKIYLLHGDLTPQQMNSFYNHPKIKAMVSFTHGEGFGRPLLEFSVTGKPVLASDWSGHIDFLPNENTFRLPGELKEVDKSVLQKDVIIEGSKWFYVNYGYASKMMKDIYRKYKDYLAISRKQRKYVKDNYTLDLMTEKFIDIVKQAVPEPVKLNLPKLKLPKLEKING
tara:strand:- start:295 stop:1488 length:1194 start_codon:yes stop_codon:yes gene_type:complete